MTSLIKLSFHTRHMVSEMKSSLQVESLDGKKVAALKIESNAVEGGSAIKLEVSEMM